MKAFRKISSILNRNKSEIHSNPIINSNCSEFEVNNWIISDFIINKIIPICGTRPYPLNELLLMVSAVCRFKPKYIFEWGTHVGVSARIFYETSLYFNTHTIIHSIDLPDSTPHIEHPKNNRGLLVNNIKKVILHQGDGLSMSLKICKDKSINNRVLFFLDGDHEYASVKKELTEIIKNIPHANILIHDTFYQSEKSGYNIGPHKAITEIVKKYPKKFKIILTETGLPGMTLLYSINESR